MEIHFLATLALALALNEVIHVLLETMSVRNKVARLSSYIAGKPYKEMSLKIDTRTKSYAISIVSFLAVTVVCFGIFAWLDLSVKASLQTTAILLVIAYAITAVNLDQYHVDIEKVTRPFIKKGK